MTKRRIQAFRIVGRVWIPAILMARTKGEAEAELFWVLAKARSLLL